MAVGVLGSGLLIVVVFGVSTAIMMPPTSWGRETACLVACQNNLKQIAIVCKMFANEQKDEMWPALSSERGKLMFEGSAVAPEYMTETNIMVCPSNPSAPSVANAQDPALVDDHSYCYLGYVVLNEKEGLAFLDAYRKAPDLATLVAGDIPAPEGLGSGGGNKFVRLTESTHGENGELYKKLSQAEIPVVFEACPIHAPAGGNVLYMDGHVELVTYPGKFPMTPAFMEALQEVAGKPGQ